MKTKTSKSGGIIRETVARHVVTSYTARHLKRYYPPAFAKALEWWERVNQEDNFRAGEMHESLKGLFDALSGVTLKDWEYGPFNSGRNHLRVAFAQDGAEDLSGGRALAWLENNLLAQFRAPWGLNKDDKNLHENGDNGKRGRAYRKRWARWYAPGTVRACPFTGVCYDDDLIDALLKAVKSGDTLGEAFAGLADHMADTLEKEYEYDVSPEAFIEAAEANGYTWTKEGRRAW